MPANRPTIEQLRHYIDSGVTADKVAVIDPAAAPLGSDEEAAGTPIQASEIAQTRDRELEAAAPVLAQQAAARRRARLEGLAYLTLVLLSAALALAAALYGVRKY